MGTTLWGGIWPCACCALQRWSLESARAQRYQLSSLMELELELKLVQSRILKMVDRGTSCGKENGTIVPG